LEPINWYPDGAKKDFLLHTYRQLWPLPALVLLPGVRALHVLVGIVLVVVLMVLRGVMLILVGWVLWVKRPAIHVCAW
jgi:hypothetical protein